MTRWIGKQRNVADLAISSLLRRRAKNIVLLAVYTAVVFALASALFFTGSMKREAALLLRDAPGLTVQKLAAGRHDFISRSSIDAIKEIEGVGDASGRLWGYYFEPVSGANFTVMVPPDQPQPGSVIIGKGVSRVTKAEKGDLYPFDFYEGGKRILTIQTVLDNDPELLTSDLILMAEQDFRSFSGVPQGSYTDIAVDVPNEKEINTIARKITQRLPGTRPVTRDEILRTYDAVFDWRGGIMLVMLAGGVLAFVILAWDRGTALGGDEKREIGILKAVGWDTSDVILMKFWEGSVISLTAFAAGVLFAYIHVFIAGAPFIMPVIKGWSVLYPAFRLTPRLDGYQLASLFCLTVVPYVTAAIIPAWRAATIDPDSVMR